MIAKLATALSVLIVAAQPLAEAEQVRIARVGVIASGSAASSVASIEGFRQRLGELGYVEGRNIAIEIQYADEVRYAAAQAERYQDVASDLTRRG